MNVIHETAVIDEGVTIGDRTKVWHFSHVSEGAQIGDLFFRAKRFYWKKCGGWKQLPYSKQCLGL